MGGESVSCTSYAIGSHMAGPINLKLSGIDRGNSVSVLVRVRGRMIQDSSQGANNLGAKTCDDPPASNFSECSERSSISKKQ